MILPIQYQNYIMEICSSKVGKFSYIDIGLYNTRHSMYRKEAYQHEMSKSKNAKKTFIESPIKMPSSPNREIELPRIFTTSFGQTSIDPEDASSKVWLEVDQKNLTA